VSSYVHRNVIQHRINRGESIQTIQRYDPDKLDYYRYNLSSLSYLTTTITATTTESSSLSPQIMAESINLRNQEEIEIDKKYPVID
jgi:hypothetical protein